MSNLFALDVGWVVKYLVEQANSTSNSQLSRSGVGYITKLNSFNFQEENWGDRHDFLELTKEENVPTRSNELMDLFLALPFANYLRLSRGQPDCTYDCTLPISVQAFIV